MFGGLRDFLGNPARLMDAARDSSFNCDPLNSFKSDAWTDETATALTADQLKEFIDRVDLGGDHVTIHVDMRRILDLYVPNGKSHKASHTLNLFALILPIRLKRRGVEVRIIMESKIALPKNGDDKLIKLIAKAHKWFEDLKSGSTLSIEGVAIREKINPRDISRYLPLAFLAPNIIEAILDGSQPADLTVHKIKRLPALPLSWEDQRMQLGFEA